MTGTSWFCKGVVNEKYGDLVVSWAATMSLKLGRHMIYQNDRLDEALRMGSFPFPVCGFLRFSRLRFI